MSRSHSSDSQETAARQAEHERQLEVKGYSLQDAYKHIGGMGKPHNKPRLYISKHEHIGRFHVFSSAMLIMGFLSGSFLGQQMQFVELAPTW